MKRIALRARVTRPYWRRRFHSFGEGSILDKPDWVAGAERITVGDRVIIMRDVWLAVERRALNRTEPALRIGNRVTISRWCRISAAESVTIEDAAGISAMCTIVDSDHTLDGPTDKPLFNPMKTAPIRIGYGSWVGERVTVSRGVTVGRFCIIGANSVVRGEIPDNSVAVGAPARVVGRTQGPPWWREGRPPPSAVWLGPHAGWPGEERGAPAARGDWAAAYRRT